MINAKILENKKIFYLLQEYVKQFKEPALLFEPPTGRTGLPNNVTETELIQSLERCLKEKIKIGEIYPTLNSIRIYKKGTEI